MPITTRCTCGKSITGTCFPDIEGCKQLFLTNKDNHYKMEPKHHPGAEYQNLFDYLVKQHSLTLLQSEMDDLIEMVHKFHGRGAVWPLFVIDKATGDRHEINKLVYHPENEAFPHVWSDTWYGHHVIGQDCEWAQGATIGGAPAIAKPYDDLYRLVFSNLAKLRARTQNNERIVDMADNIRAIIEDVTTKMQSMPQPERINNPGQLYQSDESPAAAREEDAVEFAEWLYKNRWFHFENGRWEYTFEMGSSVSRGEYLKNYIKTSAQLYELFKQQKEK